MEEFVNLRGIILLKYRTIGNYANKVGWKRNKASRVLNGKQAMDINDITEVAKCLEIKSQDTFMQIFFASLSTLWTNAA